MNKVYINDKIRRGDITYKEGDEVIVIRRKKNGYPHQLEDGVSYFIRDIEGGKIIVARRTLDGLGFLQPIKVHSSYICSKHLLRDIKINDILKQTQ